MDAARAEHLIVGDNVRYHGEMFRVVGIADYNDGRGKFLQLSPLVWMNWKDVD